MINVVCPNCNTEFEKSLGQYNSNEKRGHKSFCGRDCRDDFNKVPLIEFDCDCCGKLASKTKRDYNKSQHHFCSMLCYSKFKTGKSRVQKSRKQLKQYLCKTCGILIGNGFKDSKGRKLCDNCPKNTGKNYVDWSKVSVKDFKVRFKTNHQYHARVRSLARNLYKQSKLPKLCTKCGYSLHYEVCHIKSVKDFDDSQMISDINSPDNLLALCPNCHWELDNHC